MRELIRGYDAKCRESAAANGRIDAFGTDLDAFSRVLLRSDALHQAMVDTGIPGRVRRDIVDDLLASKSTPEARALVGFCALYEAPGEFPGSIGALAGIAELAAAHPDAAADVEPQASRTSVRERIRGFAERAFEELEALEEIDEVEDELFRIARLLDDNPDFRRALQDSNTPYLARAALLRDVLAQRARPSTLSLSLYVFRAGRLRDVVGTFDWLVGLAAAERGRRIAEVRSAVDLDDTERERLAVALGRLVNRTVEVRTIIDPSVIGGVLISVGDLMIDGTVRLRFERLRDLIAPSH